MILPRSFYARSTVTVAQELLGKKLVRSINGKTVAGIITETEAYCASEPACHAYRGQTKRNGALFGPVGHSYVYFIYGNHHCLNIVSRDVTQCAGGVLIRALMPIEGIETMQQLRHGVSIDQLSNGPGKIGQALHITLQDNHIDVTKKGALYITEGITVLPNQIHATKRIGISKAQERLWRFVISIATH
ncbi:MAG: DNA-3-methyladenine glycosylase [Candidatus Babeliales bacterium]